MSPRPLAWILPGLLGLLACGEPAQGESTGGTAGQGGAGQAGIAGAAGVTAGGQAGAPLAPCALWSAPEGDDLDERLPDLPIHLPDREFDKALRDACDTLQIPWETLEAQVHEAIDAQDGCSRDRQNHGFARAGCL